MESPRAKGNAVRAEGALLDRERPLSTLGSCPLRRKSAFLEGSAAQLHLAFEEGAQIFGGPERVCFDDCEHLSLRVAGVGGRAEHGLIRWAFDQEGRARQLGVTRGTLAEKETASATAAAS